MNLSFWWCFGEIHCKPQGDIQTPYIGSDSAKSLQFYWPESWSILCRASERNMLRHFLARILQPRAVSAENLSANLFFWGWTIVTNICDEWHLECFKVRSCLVASFPICQHCRWFLQDFSPKKSPLFFFFRLGNPPSISQLSQHFPDHLTERWRKGCFNR